MPIHDSLHRRWRLLLSRLNEVEARARDDDERLAMGRYVDERTSDAVPSRVVLRPRAGDATELGPACPLCGVGVSTREELVACTTCLGVYHRRCRHERAPCAAGCGAAGDAGVRAGS